MCAPRSLERNGGDTFRDYYSALLRHYPTMAVGFADSFDDARYGGGQVAIATTEADSIAAVIAAELEREPYPLTRAELGMWADFLGALYSRLRLRPLAGARSITDVLRSLGDGR